MDLVIAICITLLFSVWVWDLKHQVSHLEGRPVTGVHKPRRRSQCRPYSMSQTRIGDHVPAGPDGAKCVRENGVRTWTLE